MRHPNQTRVSVVGKASTREGRKSTRQSPNLTHWSVLAGSYSSSYFIRLRCAPESPPKPSEREPRRPAVIGATTTLILRLSPAMVAAIDKRTKAGGINRSEPIRRLSDWRQRSRICRRQSMNRAWAPLHYVQVSRIGEQGLRRPWEPALIAGLFSFQRCGPEQQASPA